MKLSELPGNPTNPRKISEEQLETLKRSIEKYGDLSCFVFNRNTNRLCAGHQRKKVLDDGQITITKTLKEPDKQGTICLGHVTSKHGIMAYREVVWTEEDEKLASIAANNLTGSNDNSLLKEDLLYLDAHNMDLKLTGLELPDIEKILGLQDRKTKEIQCPKCQHKWSK